MHGDGNELLARRAAPARERARVAAPPPTESRSLPVMVRAIHTGARCTLICLALVQLATDSSGSEYRLDLPSQLRGPPPRPGFGETATQILVGSNATRGNTTFGPGTNELFAIAGPSQSAGVVSISTRRDHGDLLDVGQEAGRYVTYTVDLQPPLGPNTYIDGVTITYTLSGANSTAVSFGLRRDAPDGCCAAEPRHSLQDYCDGLYTARLMQVENGGEQTVRVDRSTITYVTRDNATRGAAFEHTIMSPVSYDQIDALVLQL